MDEKQAYEQITAEYERRIKTDSRLAALRKRLESDKVTLKDAHDYVDRTAEIFGECFGRRVLDIAQGEREGTCTALMRDRIQNVDETSESAQSAVLARQGLNIRPKSEAYPEERIFKLAHSLEDPTATDEQIERRADSASATVMRSRFDENMKKGAKTCAEAGLKTYIVRDGSSKCCEWCAGISGRYAYGSEPKDVYRRHDNCSCSVVYESGRGRQNVWSKQYWSAEQEQKYLEMRDEMKAKKLSTLPEGAKDKPVRLSKKEIQAIMERVGGLTFGENGVIINTEKKSGVRTTGEELSSNAQKYLSELKKYGDTIRGKSTDFTMRELAEMSRATGVEFGKIIIGEESVLTRGDAQGTFFTEKILEEAFSKNGLFEYHSHPYDNDLSPSKSDEDLLRMFDERVGQKTSKIVAPNNKYSVFGVDGVAYIKSLEADNSIDDEYAKALMRIFGGDFNDNN